MPAPSPEPAGTTICVSSYFYMNVLMLRYMCRKLIYVCPHTTICLSSYHYMCVLIPLYVCPYTTISLSSCYYMCVLVLLYGCPHTTTSVSTYYSMYVCGDRSCLEHGACGKYGAPAPLAQHRRSRLHVHFPSANSVRGLQPLVHEALRYWYILGPVRQL